MEKDWEENGLLSIELPLCAKCCPHLHKHSHLNLTSAVWANVIYFFKWGNGSSERLSNLLKDTQQTAEPQTEFRLPKVHASAFSQMVGFPHLSS